MTIDRKNESLLLTTTENEGDNEHTFLPTQVISNLVKFSQKHIPIEHDQTEKELSPKLDRGEIRKAIDKILPRLEKLRSLLDRIDSQSQDVRDLVRVTAQYLEVESHKGQRKIEVSYQEAAKRMLTKSAETIHKSLEILYKVMAELSNTEQTSEKKLWEHLRELSRTLKGKI